MEGWLALPNDERKLALSGVGGTLSIESGLGVSSKPEPDEGIRLWDGWPSVGVKKVRIMTSADGNFSGFFEDGLEPIADFGVCGIRNIGLATSDARRWPWELFG